MKWFCQISWDEVPHLPPAIKDDLYKHIPPYQRAARTKGIPQLGQGAIYPIGEDEISIADFPIPKHWPRAYALDTGWNWFAAIWGAMDRESNTLYLYSCYKRGQAEPSTHAEAIRARGVWIPGVGDAANINQADGRQWIDIYRNDYGLDITLPIKAVEAGIYEVFMRMTAGKLKVFRSLQPWWEELRYYQRDEKGKVVKGNDHLMDSTRYLVSSGMDRARAVPEEPKQERAVMLEHGSVGLGWMGA